jgi:hypothetical protein
MAGVREWIRIGLVKRDDFVATGRMGDDTEGATDLVREFGDATEFCIALNLDTNEHEVAGNEAGCGATFVDTIPVGLATILDDKGDDLAGEIDMLGCVLDVVKDGRAWVGGRCDRVRAVGVQSEVEREFEFTAHSRNAADDVGAIDGTAVPSVGGNHGSLDPNEVSAAIGAGNSDSFVEVAEKALDANGFVIAT